MLYQLSGDPMQIVWLIVSTIIYGLLIYVSIIWLSSKTKANDKKIMVFIVAVIGIWLVPLIGGAIGGVLTSIGNLFSFIPETTNMMGSLTIIIIFLLLLVVIKYLIDVSWDKGLWIALLSLFLLYLLFSIVPYVGQYSYSP